MKTFYLVWMVWMVAVIAYTIWSFVYLRRLRKQHRRLDELNDICNDPDPDRGMERLKQWEKKVEK